MDRTPKDEEVTTFFKIFLLLHPIDQVHGPNIGVLLAINSPLSPTVASIKSKSSVPIATSLSYCVPALAIGHGICQSWDTSAHGCNIS
jgi:hypothetical protein